MQPPVPPSPSPDVYRVVVGKVVGALRDQAGLSQSAVADRAGMTQSTLSRIEHGQLMPDAHDLSRLAQALDRRPAKLQALIDDAVAGTEQAATALTGKQRGTPWWQVTLGAVGLAGLTGLAAYAIAKLLTESNKEP
jgi:transcriptional regulator with XRE-family HTH domain